MTLDCVGWFGYDTGLRLWFETNKGDDDAIPLYKDQQQRIYTRPEPRSKVAFAWRQGDSPLHRPTPAPVGRVDG